VIEVGILKYAYTKIGGDRRYVFLVLLLSLVGSYVNIPVAHLPGEQVITGRTITYFGMRYIIPMVQEWPGTVLAVNLGGAVLPTLLSLYLLCKHRLYVSSRRLRQVDEVMPNGHAARWISHRRAGLDEAGAPLQGLIAGLQGHVRELA
jgi:uncharacterized membrane protein